MISMSFEDFSVLSGLSFHGTSIVSMSFEDFSVLLGLPFHGTSIDDSSDADTADE